MESAQEGLVPVAKKNIFVVKITRVAVGLICLI